MREKISACITCFNEEDKIERCLKSLAWCDEIVVVDSFSTDSTIEICRKYTDKVYQHEWLGYIGQKNYVMGKAGCEWIIFLDADEEMSPDLRDEILTQFDKGHDDIVGYQFPRLVYYLGRWVKHGVWYPDIKLRLFRKRFGRSAGVEPHDHVEVDGPVRTLRNPIWHYTYDDISDHLQQINRFSTISAKEKFKDGMRFQWSDLLFRPAWRFLKGYFFKLGFLEGFHGFLVAVVCSFEVHMKYSKLRELELLKKKGDLHFPPESSV